MTYKIFFLLGLLPLIMRAQVVITIPQPTGFVTKDHLWNLMVLNHGNDVITVKIKLIIRAEQDQVTAIMTSRSIFLQPGVKIITSADVAPVNYDFLSMDLSREFIAPGRYSVCYEVLNEKDNYTVSKDCIQMNINPLSPPILNSPANKSEIETPYPQFSWSPPAPAGMFSALEYDLIVSEIWPGQTAKEAIATNVPVYTKHGLLQPFEIYPHSYTELQESKHYAWQVIARDGNKYAISTEAWEFSVVKDSVEKIISLAPFIKLNKEAAEVSVAHQGFLKMEISNLAADTSGDFTITRITGNRITEDSEFHFIYPLNPGQNFIVYDMNKHIHLNKNDVYKVEYRNSYKESLSMRFVPFYYR